MKSVPTKSWMSSKIEVRPTKDRGRGLFAKVAIPQGEEVVRFGGIPMTAEEIRAGRANPHSFIAVSEDCFVGVPVGSPEQGDEYLNHSCDPNLWMIDEVTLVARRHIQPNEELTADYAMWEFDESWQAPWRCTCGASECRGKFTGIDYRTERLDRKYCGHIAPFLKERLRPKITGEPDLDAEHKECGS
jgi:hypothetical protein